MGHEENGGHITECEGWEKLAMVKDFWTQWSKINSKPNM